MSGKEIDATDRKKALRDTVHIQREMWGLEGVWEFVFEMSSPLKK